MDSISQIPGIHGYPNIPWDLVCGGGTAIGYCAHFSTLFPPWHRPYLALFEVMSATRNHEMVLTRSQCTLWGSAQRIAAKYPTSLRSTYQDAVETLRLPYWDWSLNLTMPDITTQQSVTIQTPQGVKGVPNPLYAYSFHPVSSTDFPDPSVSEPHVLVSPLDCLLRRATI